MLLKRMFLAGRASMSLCFDYSGNFWHVIVCWHRVNWPRNYVARNYENVVCTLEELICAESPAAWCTITLTSHTKGISRWLKKIPIGFQTHKKKKKKTWCKELLRLTPSINGPLVDTRVRRKKTGFYFNKMLLTRKKKRFENKNFSSCLHPTSIIRYSPGAEVFPIKKLPWCLVVRYTVRFNRILRCHSKIGYRITVWWYSMTKVKCTMSIL